MNFNESSVHFAVSQEATPNATPSPPAISATCPGGTENDPVIDGNESGGLRPRGRRRRPGRARVKVQETTNDESTNDPTISNNKVDESSDFLQPQSIRFEESESPSPTPSKVVMPKGSFRSLVSKVSQKCQPTKKQGKTHYIVFVAWYKIYSIL